MAEEVARLPFGYAIRRRGDLLWPYYIAHGEERNEVLTRQGLLVSPLGAAGYVLGGPLGAAVGGALAVALGLHRHRRVHR